MRFIIVEDNKIINTIEYEAAPDNPPPGFSDGVTAIQNDSADQTWTWSGSAFVAPARPAALIPQSISDRQFFQQLAVQGIITEADALASNAAVIPAALLTIINAMPSDQQFNAKMLVSGATVFERNNPMTIAIGTAYGWASDQIDAFFTAAAKL